MKSKLPSVINFWWDFSSPGELPLKLECNHPDMPCTITTFNSVDEAEAAIRKLQDIPIHPRMKPERILNRVKARLAEGDSQ